MYIQNWSYIERGSITLCTYTPHRKMWINFNYAIKSDVSQCKSLNFRWVLTFPRTCMGYFEMQNMIQPRRDRPTQNLMEFIFIIVILSIFWMRFNQLFFCGWNKYGHICSMIFILFVVESNQSISPEFEEIRVYMN